MKRKLPVIGEGSLRKDGSRNFIHPADVKGRFTNLKRVVFAVLIVIYLTLPFVDIGGHPALFLDVVQRRFYLFGASFNAQDFWLILFLLTGVGLSLFVLTTLYGRVWCGYACPHTVFLEGIYRPIERALEGPRAQRMKRNAAGLTFDKAWRKGVKHLLFIVVSLALSHFFLSYFVSLPSLLSMMARSPAEHPTAFTWIVALTAALYINFAWFREQMCLVICPYGRLQSTLTDEDTLVVGYDALRGEPRGKKKDSTNGDCVDCNRCVVVCPTGIDIRKGLQMECVGCAACIDACDAVMDKVGRDRGLVRYDTLRGLEKRDDKPKSRGRLFFYGALACLWLASCVWAFSDRIAFEATLLRPPGGMPYVVDGEEIRNTLRIHLVNKGSEGHTYQLESLTTEFEVVLGSEEAELDGGGSRYIPVIVRGRRDTSGMVRIRVTQGEETRVLEAPFVGPG